MTLNALPESVLTKHQIKQFSKMYTEDGQTFKITAQLRYDDECGNGHNYFAITAMIQEKRKRGWVWSSGGCCHDVIAKQFPALAHLIKWHLVSSDGPMHYIENAMYWAGFRGYCDGCTDSPPNLENLKSTIVFEEWCRHYDAFDAGDFLLDVISKKVAESDFKVYLEKKLSVIMAGFKRDMVEMGFIY